MNRDEFMKAMKEKNIGTGLHFRAVICIRITVNNLVLSGDFPYAEDVCERIVSLPLFPHDRCGT